MNIVPSHIHVGLMVKGHAFPIWFYQPIEQGWRCQEDGPYRHDEDGNLLTFPTLDHAIARIVQVDTTEEGHWQVYLQYCLDNDEVPASREEWKRFQ